MKSYAIFDPKLLYELAEKYRSQFTALGVIENDLNTRFAQLEDPILALILATASREPLLFKGPPGTAKSWLVRTFCRYIGIDTSQSAQTKPGSDSKTDYFEYLLTPFTEPGELFGHYDIAKVFKDKVLERKTQGMMQKAKVVYLDEVFKGSSAILNSLLAFMNERVFHDRGEVISVEWRCLFGATNEVPYTSELRAIYDRFLLRCDIGNIDVVDLRVLQNLLNKGWKETYGERSHQDPSKLLTNVVATYQTDADHLDTATFMGLLDRLDDFREEADQLLSDVDPFTAENNAFLGKLSATIDIIRRHGLSEMSNRRAIKFLRIMLIHAIYQSINDPARKNTAAKSGIRFTDKELKLLRFMLDRRDVIAEEHLNLEL